ncbi:hypothetical protein DICPUDRAFT_154724 [Dictyostelium purpureum]|uniref:Uncharacterized protein n=1 Tax=Dictyostelium purpureum TaxID=5786 RepID=F0ZS35_DICPU|nr:uncharacterized protein DICPUDRAFT_154724 [Dictyostelium purpureum]EGC33245.1 hypothetical protein DICPUDRAFT_154724 [Dictyostelium purpureum]|eukprot:XP_003290238.1 hypothetical protein DICPUDRAFT_154724 [Dictyostelium purpureum]
MDSLIHKFNNLNVSKIGNPEFDPVTKMKDVRGILNTNFKDVNLILTLTDDIKSIISLDQAEVFQRKLTQHVKDKIESFRQPKHGILNSGKRLEEELVCFF